jgi:membrane fusion protein (multidrug efflux system)
MVINQHIPRHRLFQQPTYLLTAFFLLLSGVITAPAKALEAQESKHVIVAPVVSQQVSDRAEALGTARANESVSITASITEKVTQIHFDDGQQVKAGDILVVLEQSEEQAELKRAQAVSSERKLTLDRLRQLKKRQLTSQEEVDRTRLELEQADASISAIKTRINDRIIRAPFDGTIGLRNISVGALVETGDVIATLDDTRVIKLDFSVPSLFLTELRPGMKIKAHAAALGGKQYLGEVKSIDSRIDPVTRSIQVRALLPNPDGSIIPGILMQVDLLRNTRQALVIPEAALLPLADRQYVLVRIEQDGTDTVEKRQVVIGLRLPGYVEVLEGLRAGEQVVTHGNSRVQPGDTLDVLAVDDGSTDISTILKEQNSSSKTTEGKKP